MKSELFHSIATLSLLCGNVCPPIGDHHCRAAGLQEEQP